MIITGAAGGFGRLVAAAAADRGAHVVGGVMPLAFFSDHEAAADAWSRRIDINIRGVLNGTIAVYDRPSCRPSVWLLG